MTTVFRVAGCIFWFLASLLCCLAISAVLVNRKMVGVLVALSLLLFLVGLAGKAYADTPIGFHVGFNFRNGPFFGLIFLFQAIFSTEKVLESLGSIADWC